MDGKYSFSVEETVVVHQTKELQCKKVYIAQKHAAELTVLKFLFYTHTQKGESSKLGQFYEKRSISGTYKE